MCTIPPSYLCLKGTEKWLTGFHIRVTWRVRELDSSCILLHKSKDTSGSEENDLFKAWQAADHWTRALCLFVVCTKASQDQDLLG